MLGTMRTEIPHMNMAKPYIKDIIADFACGLERISGSSHSFNGTAVVSWLYGPPTKTAHTITKAITSNSLGCI